MNSRAVRWVLLALALVFLLRSVFGTVSLWSVGGFLACGGCWYWLSWRKRRELDAPKPK